MRYLGSVLGVVFRHGWYWWISLAISYLLGIGLLRRVPSGTPAGHWLARGLADAGSLSRLAARFLFLLWVVAHLAHKEAMRHLRAARIVFGPPHAYRSVDMFGRPQFEAIRTSIGKIDVGSIKVSNVPYDGENGKSVTDAFARIEFYDKATRKRVLDFDYPRWEGNPKPGYHDNPSDHYPDDSKSTSPSLKRTGASARLSCKKLERRTRIRFPGTEPDPYRCGAMRGCGWMLENTWLS